VGPKWKERDAFLLISALNTQAEGSGLPVGLVGKTYYVSRMPRPIGATVRRRCDAPPRGSTAALPLLVGHSPSSGLEGQRLVSVIQ